MGEESRWRPMRRDKLGQRTAHARLGGPPYCGRLAWTSGSLLGSWAHLSPSPTHFAFSLCATGTRRRQHHRSLTHNGISSPLRVSVCTAFYSDGSYAGGQLALTKSIRFLPSVHVAVLYSLQGLVCFVNLIGRLIDGRCFYSVLKADGPGIFSAREKEQKEKA